MILKKSFHSFYRIFKNLFYDLSIGGVFLGGNKSTRFSMYGAYDTVNTDYEVLGCIFSVCLKRLSAKDVFVDIGCGKGRVINWLLKRGIENEIIGLEIDPAIAQRTKRRLRKYHNVQVIAGNAIENLPGNGSIFYLYNPFDRYVMRKFIDKIIELFRSKKEIVIIYHNCVHIDVFYESGNFSVSIMKIHGQSHYTAIINLL